LSPPFRHFRLRARRNIARDACEIYPVARVIRPRIEGICAMKRSSGALGFSGRPAPVASSRLWNAVAATLAIGSLSLCLVVTLTVLSIKVSMAMPLPA
jgi:hypothetical protein